jgi:Cof subfamily protein (haloacid dehalogenase superfamily)
VIRLLATDLDGTLLQSGGTVSQENVKALALAAKEGLDVIFVTGRPPRWMTDIPAMTGYRGLAICANGALTMDLASGEILSATHIDPQVGLEVCDLLREVDPGITFAAELSLTADNFVIDPQYQTRWERDIEFPRMSVEQMFETESVIKLMARPSVNANVDADSFLSSALAVVDGHVEVTHSDIHNVLLEMSVLGVNKGTGLERYSASLGHDASQVSAVGDMPNDIEMIRWAGRGAAVANAHDEVKAVANVHLPSNDEHAVAVLINSILSN